MGILSATQSDQPNKIPSPKQEQSVRQPQPVRFTSQSATLTVAP